MRKSLNARQREFCRLYLAGPPGVCGVASKAYLHAGYKATLRSAEVCGSRLLRHPVIKQAINEYHREADRQTEEFIRQRYGQRDPMLDVMRARMMGREPVEVL